jgi:tRNA(fMet)-specific endonuclease VapC
MICLDTNTIIAVLKGEPPHLINRFDHEVPQGILAISTVVLFELDYGIAHSVRREKNAARLRHFLKAPIEILPFDRDDAHEAGEIRAQLRRAGTPIGPYDILIAAQARRRGAVLVTANIGEFSRVPGLATENWLAA